MTGKRGAGTWIEAGLAALAKGGVEAVRVEVLAKRLGVTKGGFYWHFADRAALLTALLDTWRDGRVAAIAEQTERAGGDATERLAGLIRLYGGRASPRGLAIELAIRQWARRDAAAAAAVAAVDGARLENVGRLYRALGCDAEEAEARAVLFYAFVFGQSLLVPGSERAAERTRAACAAMLVNIAPSGRL
jgi:AcrR family transcriptional regulator